MMMTKNLICFKCKKTLIYQNQEKILKNNKKDNLLYLQKLNMNKLVFVFANLF